MIMLVRIIIVLGLCLSGTKLFTQNVPTEIDRLFNTIKNSKGAEKAEALRELGNYVFDICDYASALNYHQEALEIFRKLNDANGERNTLLSISSDYFKMGSLDKAHYYTNELLLKSAEAKDVKNLAGALNNKALAQINQNKIDSAINTCLQALSVLEKTNDTTYINVAIINNLAMLYSEQGKVKNAYSYLQKALMLLSEAKNTHDVAIVMVNLANQQFSLKRYRNALDTSMIALQLSTKGQYLEVQLAATNLISQIYESSNNKDSALAYLKKSISIKDTLLVKQNSERIYKIEIRNTLKEKEHENQLLVKNDKIKSLQLENQRTWIYTLIIGMSIVLVLLVIVFYQSIRQLRTNKSLVKTNLEIVQSEKKIKEANKKLQAQLSTQKVQVKKQTNPSIQTEQTQALLSHLLQALDEQKIFTKPELTLSLLATELNTNRTYLSQIIKEHFNAGFTEVINNYRVKEARSLLASPENANFTVDHIGAMAGFNSKASFYAVFKQHTGVTPSYFQKSVPDFK